MYTREEYVAAYHWFGWKLAKAERMYDEGKLYDNLVREWKKNSKTAL